MFWKNYLVNKYYDFVSCKDKNFIVFKEVFGDV